MSGGKLLLFLFVICASFTFGSQKFNDKTHSRMARGLRNYIQTGQRSADFRLLLESLRTQHVLRRNAHRKDIVSGVSCVACQVAVGILLKARRAGAERDSIANVLGKLCYWSGIQTKEVCTGVIQTNIDILVYIVDNRPNLKANRICSIILQYFDCESPPGYDWSIEIPPGYSGPRIQSNSSSLVKIAHLTDFHYDPLYSPGSNAECKDALCCAESQGVPANEKAKAGYWGDYRNCDSPWHAILDALDHISTNQPDLSYVYYTGDIVSHRIWKTGFDANTKTITSLLEQFRKTFGSIPVFPVLGNHEPHPLNVFAPLNITDPKFSTQWLYDLVADEWGRWLPPETKETIRMGGYYTVLVKPGFRIIALNSNTCYIYNWWTIYDAVDPYGQLKWLVDILLSAEQNSEMVHILAHIPSPDDTCHKTWSREYRRIIERFSHIITGQFNGHTHDDELFIYYNKSNPTQAINIAWNGGSLTPFTYLNPNYVIYYADSENMEIRDYDLWMYNLEEANQRADFPPNWYKLYSFKNAYALQGLSPDHLADLAINMARSKQLLALYYRHKVRETTFRPCTGDCLLTHLCRMVTSEFGDRTQCDILTTVWKESRRNRFNYF